MKIIYLEESMEELVKEIEAQTGLKIGNVSLGAIEEGRNGIVFEILDDDKDVTEAKLAKIDALLPKLKRAELESEEKKA